MKITNRTGNTLSSRIAELARKNGIGRYATLTAGIDETFWPTSGADMKLWDEGKIIYVEPFEAKRLRYYGMYTYDNSHNS